MALVVAIPVGISLGSDGAGAIVALFVLVVPFEKLFRRHDHRLRRPGLRTDLTYALASPVLNVAGIAIAIGVALLVFPLWLPTLALRPLVMSQPGWLMAVETVLLLDILIYWTHRLSHTVGFLWRFHSIHHSSERMDWISGIRQHPVDGVIIGVPVLAMAVAGFQLEVVGAVAVIQIVIGLFAHANVRWRLRPLHKIVMTPEFHHWHHANHPESIHTNFSVFLPVWDLIWGTYRMPTDERPERYGTDEPTPPSVPGQMLFPFRRETRERYPFPPALRARIPFTRARRERVDTERAERAGASK
jgi:sterol desaturase/sphingolipid hydroxylase (fatty acid hydroxylase superfamily)